MKNILLALTLCLLFGSCENNEEKYRKIIGVWHCTSWTSVRDKTDRCDDNVAFAFNNDKTYSSQLGSEKDQGKFTISGNLLTVSPEGKMDISVEILTLNETELKLLMNNAGIEETLVLKKQ